jgi:hypothetical protein
MDSQSFDSDFGSIGTPNPLLLEENQILFSQQYLFLQDMMGGGAEENNLSVFIDEENSSKVTHLIHARPDCVVYPFLDNPKLYCAKCYCYRCQESACKCLFWDAHCHATSFKDEDGGDSKDIMKEVPEKSMTVKGETLKKKTVQKAPLTSNERDKKPNKKTEACLTGSKKSTLQDYPKKEKNARKENIIEDYKERAEVAEAASEELKKKVGTTIDNYRRRAEQAETALEE